MIFYGKYFTKIHHEIYGSDCGDCANSDTCKNANIFDLGKFFYDLSKKAGYDVDDDSDIVYGPFKTWEEAKKHMDKLDTLEDELDGDDDTTDKNSNKNIEVEASFVGFKINIYDVNICNNFEYYTEDEELKKNFKIEIELDKFLEIGRNAEKQGQYNIDDELKELIKSTHDIPDFDYEEWI